MYNLSTQDVVQSIEKSPLVNLNGIVYQDYSGFFSADVLKMLANASDLVWVPLEDQENKPRLRAAYETETMKHLRTLFMRTPITEALAKKFSTPLTFDSVDIWQDRPGYFLKPHTDDYRIKLALQVYLGEDNIGTSLFDDNHRVIKTFRYEYNCGYALLNNDQSLHGTQGEVVKGKRRSVYVRYR